MNFANHSLNPISIPRVFPKHHFHCSIVIYFYLNLVFQPSFSQLVPSSWNYLLPGGLAKTYHIVLVQKELWKIKEPNQLSLPFRLMINQLFVFKSNSSNDLELYDTDIWCKRFRKLPKHVTFFRDRETDLEGARLIWMYVTMKMHDNENVLF
jgi:hypothetical protein